MELWRLRVLHNVLKMMAFCLLVLMFTWQSTFAEPRTGPAKQAAAIMEATDVKGGLIVHIGCGDGRLTAGLYAGESYLVQGLDTDPAKVKNARKHIQSLGLYGKVSVDTFDGSYLPYIDNFINLIVVQGSMSGNELHRVLAPGGTAYVQQGKKWTKTIKPRSDNIDDWTHFLHSASNNPVARDQVIAPPRHLQWICPPAWSKHHEVYPPTIPIIVSSGGRVFYLEDDTPACFFDVRTSWYLTARDAFNGTLLWRRPMKGWLPQTWPGEFGGGLSGGPPDYKRRLIAVGDSLYVTLGHDAPVTQLDAATGKTIRTICEGAPRVELLFEQGVLYVISGEQKGDGLKITAFDTHSHKQLFKTGGGGQAAINNGRIFFSRDKDIIALDAATGKLLWRSEDMGGLLKKGSKVRPQPNELFRAGAGVLLASPIRGLIAAFSTETGDLLWSRKSNASHTGSRGLEAYIIDGLVWLTDVPPEQADDRLATLTLGLDPLTGDVVKTVPSGPVWNTGHHKRCFPGKATDRFIIYSRRGTDFLELATSDVSPNNWSRGTCGYGSMPANGLLYAPPHACRCYSEVALRGLHTLAPKRATQTASRPEQANRLQKGPAYKKIVNSKSKIVNRQPWPTYRHDPQRSGATVTEVTTRIEQHWQAQFSGRVTSPVIARGNVYLAEVDAHTIHALNADDGSALWSFTAGARVDSPPTIHDGLAVFGCSDGWVYCLNADDGQLAWRFRAAASDLRLGADGQIESVWPVHGAVLVHNSVVYFAAGRGSFIDGGIYLYGLDLPTGKKLYDHHLDGPHTNAGMTRENPSRGFVMPGALPDVLVTDGEKIYMRHMAFDPKLKEAADMLPNFYEAPERTREEFGGDHKYWCDLLESGPRAFVGKPEWYFRSYFNNFPGKRLYSTTGLLDDSWHIRSYWSYGQVVGQSVVFKDDRGYAIRAYPNAARWLPFNAGQGYELYAGETAMPNPEKDIYALKAQQHLWNERLPFRPMAMVLAGETLFLAGPPDPSDPAEALAALEGKRGAKMWAVSTKDGKKLAQYQLDSLPLFDGMTAADKRLYISMKDGKIICMGE